MHISKGSLLLQKHVTEMAHFDFQVFKTAWDTLDYHKTFPWWNRGQPPPYITIWLYIEIYDTVETTFRAHLYLEDTLKQLLYINSSLYTQKKSLQK